MSAGAFSEESHDVFRNAIHPCCQSFPFALQEGVASEALVLMQKVTQVLRLTASLRARKMAPENSFETFVILLLTMKSPIAGTANVARMLANATVTISSIRVKPCKPVR